MMAIDRRHFIAGAAGLLASWAGACTADQHFVASRFAGGSAALALIDSCGAELATVPLPARGHDIALAPDGRHMVVIGRRPGWYALVIDRKNFTIINQLAAPDGRHFYGHGCFSADGRLFYATENDIDGGEGLLGLYDATRNFIRIGEWHSGGIGPHDVVLGSDGSSLIVANGGIRTSPDTGRDILNLAAMRPNIAMLSTANGDLMARLELPADLRHLSLRHMAQSANGDVIFGGQYEGDAENAPPLVGIWEKGKQNLTLWDMPDAALARMRNYVGSVALGRDGEIVAATSPRGNTVAFFALRNGRYLGSSTLSDVCGVAGAAGRNGFLLTSGQGAIARIGLEHGQISSETLKTLPVSWDNHARLLR